LKHFKAMWPAAPLRGGSGHCSLAARAAEVSLLHNAGQQMNVIGSPANTVILHWDECETTWAQLPWRDWVRFRGFDDGGLSLLAGAEAGEHYFLVCVLDDRGELANVIPHRYVLSTDGRLVHGFDGLRQAEREEYCRIQLLLMPTIEDSERYTELDARGFAVNLPPPHTVQPLLRALPGLAGAQPSGACWHFLSAIGISRSSARAN
jgi:hypothetical protein